MSTEVTAGGAKLSDRIAEEIRALLARRRMSGRELARRLDVSPSWLSYRLTGVQPIDVNDLEMIAEVLDVNVTDLLGVAADARLRVPRSNKDVSLRHRVGPARPASRPTDGRPGNYSASVRMPSGQRRPLRI